MSGSHRPRRSRVQGGWACGSSRSGAPLQKSSGISQPLSHHGGQFLYQDQAQYRGPASSPANFSWVINGLLAGCSFLRSSSQLQFLLDQGVHYLVSLTEKTPQTQVFPGLKCIHLPVPNFTSPTLTQVQEFVSVVQKARQENKGVAVHCLHGRGRTGTLLACYLVHSQQMEAEEAIAEICRLRPRSVETHQQEQTVHQYAACITTSRAPMEEQT